jgi:transcriptional regulator with XRE-family HTH domain
MMRVNKEWSQEYVAEKSGYSLKYFRMVERGAQNPTYRFMLAVAPLFNLTPSQLLARAERMHLRRPTGSPASARPKKWT